MLARYKLYNLRIENYSLYGLWVIAILLATSYYIITTPFAKKKQNISVYI